MRKTLWVFCALLGSAGAVHAQPSPIGRVKAVTGEATIVRQGAPIAVAPGLALLQGDVLRTGPRGTLGVILRDDTTLSLGASSEVHLTEFVFDPAQAKLGLVLRLTRGLLAYASGKIARLAPEAARVETPVATLGIRGTRLAVKVGR
ncbi:MAG TPA: FecR domain-containing protein [Vicinamibacteria bacterium]|nr:FecR domain-containing protein [Vicinamibacteria bacterium]